MNKRSLFISGLLPWLTIVLCTCGGSESKENNACDDDDYKPYRYIVMKLADFETAVCFDPTANKPVNTPVTEEEQQMIERFKAQRRENYQYIIDNITLSWSASDSDGNPIGGVVEPDTLDVDSEQILYKLGKNDKWLQKLEVPPTFTAHVEGNLYEDLVFTVRDDFFDNKNKNPHSACYDQYYKMDMASYFSCVFLRKKQLSCEPEGDLYTGSYMMYVACQESGFEVISY